MEWTVMNTFIGDDKEVTNLFNLIQGLRGISMTSLGRLGNQVASAPSIGRAGRAGKIQSKDPRTIEHYLARYRTT